MSQPISTNKEILLRLIAGAKLHIKKNVAWLRINKKGKIEVNITFATHLVAEKIVRPFMETYGHEDIYTMNFLDVLAKFMKCEPIRTMPKEELMNFILYYKSRNLTPFEKEGKLVPKEKYKDEYYFITLEFSYWYKARQRYIKAVKDLCLSS